MKHLRIRLLLVVGFIVAAALDFTFVAIAAEGANKKLPRPPRGVVGFSMTIEADGKTETSFDGCHFDPREGARVQKINKTQDTTNSDTLVWYFDRGNDARLVGEIKDENNGPVGGAKIKTSGIQYSRQQRRATSDVGGQFQTNLSSGLYKVSVSKKGCQTFVREGWVCAFGAAREKDYVEQKSQTTSFNVVLSCNGDTAQAKKSFFGWMPFGKSKTTKSEDSTRAGNDAAEKKISEPSLAEQFAELEKELQGAKASGKYLAHEHSKRVFADIEALENKGYSKNETARLRALATHLSPYLGDEQRQQTREASEQKKAEESLSQSPAPTPAQPVSPSPSQSSAPIPAQPSSPSPPSPSSSPSPSPTQAPREAVTAPAQNSWLLPFSVADLYDSGTKSQGEVSFAGEWVVRPFGGSHGAAAWQPGNTPDVEFELVPGTILRASASGKVTFFKNAVSTLPDGEVFDPKDWELHIQFGDGTYYLVYDHVIDIRVANGATVKAGDAIARASPASIRHGGSQGKKPVDELEWGFRRASPQATGICPWDYLTEAERAKARSVLETMKKQGFSAGDSFCLKQETPG